MGWLGKLFGKEKAVVVEPPKEKEEDRPVLYVHAPGDSADTGVISFGDNTSALPAVTETIVKPLKKIEPLDLMKVTFKASPNKSNRVGAVEYIVLHHTSAGSFDGIVNWLCNKEAKASAHYVLGSGGKLKQLVNSNKESWHAGVAKWNDKRIDNHKSIGIEICNIGRMGKGEDGGYYYEQGRSIKKYCGKIEPVEGIIVYPDGATVSGYYVPYPEKQVEKLIALCKALVVKYPSILRENILTHYQIAYPFGRKQDPFGLDLEYIRDMVFFNG